MDKAVKIKSFGHQCILLQWEAIKPSEIHETQTFIENKYAEEALDIVPTYQEIAIYLHENIDKQKIILQLKEHLSANNPKSEVTNTPIYHIPVCYEKEMGIDLERLANSKNISCEQLIQMHTSAVYTVHFLGFLPGFPYLSGLNKLLYEPRLKTPRAKVLAGSVGIAGKQCGIYPQDSPGGWNIIGRTPLKLFDINQSPPALLKSVKRIQFFQINKEKYNEIKSSCLLNKYQIEVSYD